MCLRFRKYLILAFFDRTYGPYIRSWLNIQVEEIEFWAENTRSSAQNKWPLVENMRSRAETMYPEKAQKAIEGANVTCRNMHLILR